MIHNILITGGAGFIGSKLALKLISKGYNVTILDNLSIQIHGACPEETSPLYMSIKDNVRFIKGTVTSRNDWTNALDGQDAVIHLAAETGTGQSMYEIWKYVDTNIAGTALLLDVLYKSKHNIKRILVAESRAIYGEGKYLCKKCGYVYPINRKEEDMSKGDFECKCPICNGVVSPVATTEDSKIHPTSVYGISKQVQGQLIHLGCQTLGIESVCLRYQNVYGPGQSLSNPYTGILSIFSTCIKNHNEIDIFEDGRELRDFVYIDDVVDATILGLEVPEANGHIFNIGTGVATDVLTVANILCKKYEINVPTIVSGHFRLGDIRHNFADISIARRILGFKPKWNFTDGVESFVNWVNRQKIQDNKYVASIEEMKQRGIFK